METSSDGNLSELTNFDYAVVRNKAKEVLRKSRFTYKDLEDIQQDLTVEVLAALKKYDAGRGARNAFVTVVVENAGATLLRHHNAQRRSQRTYSLDSYTPASQEESRALQVTENDLHRVRSLAPREDSEAIQLVNDTAVSMGLLCEGYRNIADRLKLLSLKETAEATGLTRYRLNQSIKEMRGKFEKQALQDYLENPLKVSELTA